DATPPTCATGLGGGLSGADVALSWTPGTDSDFALAWQPLYRDGERIAVVVPGQTSYVDPVVIPGPHEYQVTALNQGFLEASSCATFDLEVPLFKDGFESGGLAAWSSAMP